MAEAKKYDQGKLRYDLIPPEPLRELARVYTIGAAKYGDNNWQGGLDRSRIIAALMRHMERYRAGELIDTEDGQYHLSSVAWAAFALMWYDMQDPRSCGQAYERAAAYEQPSWEGVVVRDAQGKVISATEAKYSLQASPAISSKHDSIAQELDKRAAVFEIKAKDLGPTRASNRVLD